MNARLVWFGAAIVAALVILFLVFGATSNTGDAPGEPAPHAIDQNQ